MIVEKGDCEGKMLSFRSHALEQAVSLFGCRQILVLQRIKECEARHGCLMSQTLETDLLSGLAWTRSHLSTSVSNT